MEATVHNWSLHLMMKLRMVRHVHVCICVQHVLEMLLMKIVCGWIEQHLWTTNCFISWWWLTWTRCAAEKYMIRWINDDFILNLFKSNEVAEICLSFANGLICLLNWKKFIYILLHYEIMNKTTVHLCIENLSIKTKTFISDFEKNIIALA